VLTRDPQAFARKAPHLAARANLEFIQGDIRDFVFPPGEFAYLVHAATEASAKLNEEAPHEMLDAIIGGTRRVLDFAASCGVKKLLLTSSGAVYGKQPPELTHIPEDYNGAPDPLLPGSAYGEGKRVSEHMCAVHARRHGYEVKIARCFAFVGPHLPLDAHFAIGNFIRDALAGGPIRINGDGTPLRSYLYASDLAIWLWTILFSGKSHRPYNVGSAEDISIGQLGRVVTDSVNSGACVFVAQNPDHTRPPARYCPAIERVASELGLRVRVPLSDAIRRTSAWHLS
jgi:dTDP-glucose 4,6-dehydratase